MIAGCLLFVVRRQQLLQTISPPKTMAGILSNLADRNYIKWPSRIINQTVNLDHMGKNRF